MSGSAAASTNFDALSSLIASRRPIGEGFRDFVVAVEDRFDGAQFGAVLVQRRLGQNFELSH